jgi:hypothetical protein
MKICTSVTAVLISAGVCFLGAGCAPLSITLKEKSYPDIDPSQIKNTFGKPYQVRITSPFTLSAEAMLIFNNLKKNIEASPFFEVGEYNALKVIKNELSFDIIVDEYGYGASALKGISIKTRIDILTNKKKIAELVLDDYVKTSQSGGSAFAPRNELFTQVVEKIVQDPSFGYGSHVIAQLVQKFNVVMVDLQDME